MSYDKEDDEDEKNKGLNGEGENDKDEDSNSEVNGWRGALHWTAASGGETKSQKW